MLTGTYGTFWSNTSAEPSGTTGGAGLNLNDGGAFRVSGDGNADIGGELVIGGNANSTATATISVGTMQVGTSLRTDPTMYVGAYGDGTVTQTAGSVTTTNLSIATFAGSSGIYSLKSDTGLPSVVVYGSAAVGGGLGAAGGAGTLNVAGGTVEVQGRLVVWNTSGTSVNLSGAGGLDVETLNLSGNSALFHWTDGGTVVVTGTGWNGGDLTCLAVEN